MTRAVRRALTWSTSLLSLCLVTAFCGTATGLLLPPSQAFAPGHATGDHRHQGPDPAGDRRSVGSPSAGILTLDPGDIDATPDAYKGAYVVLQSWEYARIPALRAKHPGIKILMYKDATGTRRDVQEPTGLASTGVTYQQAAAHHWLLTDSDGRVLEWSDWSNIYPADVGNAGYQQAWADNVIGLCRGARMDLSKGDVAAIRAWVGGGLLEG